MNIVGDSVLEMAQRRQEVSRFGAIFLEYDGLVNLQGAIMTLSQRSAHGSTRRSSGFVGS